MAKVRKKQAVETTEDLKDIVYINLDEFEGNYNSKKIGIRLPDFNGNILELAEQDEDVYLFYQTLLRDNYMMYWHHNKVSYFIKREFLNEIWKRDDLQQEGQLFYTIDEPIPERSSDFAPKNLLVIFSPMPLEKDKFSSNIATRCFRTFFPNIGKYLAKNTYVLRIMDANLTYGSLYRNTVNYDTMEDDVQNAIKKVTEDLNIKNDKVVIYGANNVATSAIYHANLGGYTSVAINPYETIKELNSGIFADKYLGNALTDDLTNGIVITEAKNHLVITTEEYLQDLNKLKNKVTIYNLLDKMPREDIVKNATIEATTFINSKWLTY